MEVFIWRKNPKISGIISFTAPQSEQKAARLFTQPITTKRLLLSKFITDPNIK